MFIPSDLLPTGSRPIYLPGNIPPTFCNECGRVVAPNMVKALLLVTVREVTQVHRRAGLYYMLFLVLTL